MKNQTIFIKLILFLTILFSLQENSIADNEGTFEIYILNKVPNTELLIKFYPISTVFNGVELSSFYSLKRISNNDLFRRGYHPNPEITYINGLDGHSLDGRTGGPVGYFKLQKPNTSNNGGDWKCLIGSDATENRDRTLDGLFGFGKYLLRIYKDDANKTHIVDIPIDWGDFNYPYSNDPVKGCPDLHIYINDIFSNPINISFQWSNCDPGIYGQELPLFGLGAPPLNDTLKVYEQYYYKDGQDWVRRCVTPNKGNSLSDASFWNYPLNAKSLPDGYASPEHLNNLNLIYHLSVQTNHHAKILNTKYGNKFIVEPSAIMTLKQNCSLTVASTCTLLVKRQGKLCNEGAKFFGGGKIIFEYINLCPWGDLLIHDSTQIILQDSASLEIEPNATITFDSTASLIMSPHSSIKFGTNSKLVFQHGSKLIADSATFTSVDADSTWDGIYLYDLSNDTIKNCVFENAYNGINIIDRTNTMFPSHSTEISNCTFNNTTDYELRTGIYLENSDNILIRNNTFTGTNDTSFTYAIRLDYCSDYNLNILDNEINKSDTAIVVIQSSPYIARNTLNGLTEHGTGIFLDNSNGTIEYNIINDFDRSIVCYYSSPYILQNTLVDAAIKNIELYTSSIPVLEPLNSEGIIYWTGGNNKLTGSPSTAGITLSSDAYPLMQNGYNNIVLTSSDYMSGTLPNGMYNNTLYMENNYWGASSPDSNKFDLTGALIDYNPYFSTTTNPTTNGYDLYSIGFGLYDTVYYYSTGGDNATAENLFLQAYKKERTKQYTDAINLFKQVVTNYRASNFAPIALSRIFNCAEKKGFTTNEFQQLENYLSQIKNNNSNTRQIKEIAEDFVIKTKVRRHRLQDAIDDYQAMFSNNQNSPKGTHAKLNKDVLIKIRDKSSGQSPYGYTLQNNPENKTVLPNVFRLDQNYPNPFNPMTTIKYEIPYDGNVSFVVYDMIGKEVVNKSGYMKAGKYEYQFDGSNLASGVYFYSLKIGSYFETKKMLIIK